MGIDRLGEARINRKGERDRPAMILASAQSLPDTDLAAQLSDLQ